MMTLDACPVDYSWIHLDHAVPFVFQLRGVIDPVAAESDLVILSHDVAKSHDPFNWITRWQIR